MDTHPSPEDRSVVTSPSRDVLPGTGRVRVVVDQADAPRCSIEVGDSFEVDGSRLTIPSGKPFCPYAMAAVFPVLALRQGDLAVDDWLARKPYICCPDPTEGVVMRLDRIEPDGGDEGELAP